MAKGQKFYLFPEDYECVEYTRDEIERLVELGELDSRQVWHGTLRGPVPVDRQEVVKAVIGPIPGLERKGKGKGEDE